MQRKDGVLRMRNFGRVLHWSAAIGLGGICFSTSTAGDSYADEVVSYDAGSTPIPGYTDPQTVVGSPTRFSGESFGFPCVVSPFSPPFEPDEFVSIGEGGQITLRFEEPIRNDAANLFGVDLIAFGNGGFADFDYPNGVNGAPPVTFGVDANMRVSISADGVDFFLVGGDFSEGFFPADGYLDGGPYDTSPGTVLSDFGKPVNPALTLDDFAGLSLSQIRTLYDGSGGGTPIDIAAAGLAEASFVRIELLDDGDANTSLNVEVDALSAVPEPGTLLALLLMTFACAHRRG